jgi:hypothetical protein
VSDDRSAVPGGGGIEGRYANYIQVGHNAFEFVLDFGQSYGDDRVPAVHTRIVANPAYAKVFLDVLTESVAAYQRAFGAIPAPPQPVGEGDADGG